jgi:hypothetical protein
LAVPNTINKMLIIRRKIRYIGIITNSEFFK